MMLNKQTLVGMVLLGLLSFTFFGLSNVAAAAVDPLPGLVKAAESQTRALVSLARRYEETGDASVLDALTQVAGQRRQMLLELVQADPAAALKVALTHVEELPLPGDLESAIEQESELDGTLEVVYEDYPDHHVLKHFLQTADGRLSLHFAGELPGLRSGQTVRVRGVLFRGDDAGTDGAVAIPSDSEPLILSLNGEASGSGEATIELANTFGEQRTLTLLVNFLDQPDQPISKSSADSLVLGGTSDFMQENSYGQTWLSGATYGWFTLPINATCSGTTISDAANTAAAAAGIDVAGYDRVIYMFPRNNSCGWSGQGTVGNRPSKVWLNGQFNVQVIAHEMGHNFGLYHSHSLDCGSDILSDSCVVAEYGDTLDAMGNKNAAHYNAFQKQRLGWLNYGASPVLTTVTGTGTYAIGAAEPLGSASRALRVLRSQDPVSGAKSWFYVEYRQAIGFDAFLGGNANVLGGVIVHTAEDGNANSSQLLDMTPESALFSDWEDPALAFGQSFSDPVTGLTIAPTWGDNASASVAVSYGTPTCAAAAPAVAMTPGQSAWVAPGTEVVYTVTLTNNDSAACSSATFDLSASIPNGWGAVLGQAALTLAPGASGSTTLRVSSAYSAADGFYSVAAQGANRSNPNLAGSATVTYIVSAPAANQAPVALNDQATTPERTAVTIPVLANDSDPEGDLLTVVAVGSAASGSVAINSDGSVTYSPKGRFKGSDSFSYTVSDGTGSSSAIVSVTVGSSDGGSTKGGGGGKGAKK